MFWVWVSTYYATYGIKCDGKSVVDAAPIARWMVGKPKREVIEWLYEKDPQVQFEVLTDAS